MRKGRVHATTQRARRKREEILTELTELIEWGGKMVLYQFGPSQATPLQWKNAKIAAN